MLITIDTNAVTEKDLEILTLVFDRKTEVLKAENDAAEEPTTTTTRRKRRTKAEIAADEAAAKAAAGGGTNDIQEAPQTDQELTDALDSESEKAELKVTVEQVVEEASKLIAADKTKMRAILDKFEVRRIGELPEERLGELLTAVKDQLSKLPATA